MSVPDNVDAETGEIIEPGANDRTVAALAKVEPVRSALVRTAGPWAQIEVAFKEHQELVKRLLEDSDYQEIQGKKFPKKSAWRKLAVAYGVSFEIRSQNIVREDPDDPKSKPIFAEFVVRAIAPNERFSDGWGCCDITEARFNKGLSKQHDLIATAETRAKNRAASDLFGMGEVSAEEMDGVGTTKRRTQTKQPELATTAQITKLVIVAKEAGFIEEERHEAASKSLNRYITSFKELTKQEASTLIEEWSAMKGSQKQGTGEPPPKQEPLVPSTVESRFLDMEHGDHEPEWIPSAHREGLEICNVEGCGRGRKKP